MKIFIGLHNITSLFHEYSLGFRELGHEVFTVEAEPSPIHTDAKHAVDMNVHELALLRAVKDGGSKEAYQKWHAHYMELAWQKAIESDFCLFIWKTFRPDCRDLVELKKRGIKVVVRFVGADARVDHADKPYCDFLNMPPSNRPAAKPFAATLHYVRMAEKFADLILNSSNISLRPCYGASATFLDIASVPQHGEQREVPVILHAPSGRTRKGTGEWLQIFEALRVEGYNFGLKFCERIPHQDFLAEYATADIYCGSLYIGGKADREALAAGNVVLSTSADISRLTECIKQRVDAIARQFKVEDAKSMERIWHGQQETYPPAFGYPIVPVTPATAKETLAQVILDYPFRKKMALQARAYMEQHVSPKVACQHILNILAEPESLDSHALQFAEIFFNLHYIPPQDPGTLDLYNQYNKMVKNCLWYKQYVKTGERAGLVF